ncbi:MAG TPA: restriction endonuclease [Chthoniobacter sp.]|nr:restriction endonuclease [Chthoniobacter sp.]
MKALGMVLMVLVLGSALRYGQRYILQASGVAPVSEQMKDVKFSSEEADLMTTVFKSAMRLFTGQASRKELSAELSDKLYAGRNGEDMKALGIELVQPGDAPSAPGMDGVSPAGGKAATGAGSTANPQSAGAVNAQTGAAGQPGANPAARQAGRTGKPGAKAGSPAGMPSLDLPSAPGLSGAQLTALDKIWRQAKANSLEFMLVPVVLLGMFLVHRVRRRRSGGDDFMLPLVGLQTPAESEPYDMQHPVHYLTTEEFELLIALIYQRQGYRISMSDALSGGKGGDFILARKAERILVQCKKQSQDHRIPVERIRELQEAMLAANLTRGMYVASCGFSWDARNFAKGNNITVINARTLDALLTAAREKGEGDLLDVSQWASKLMGKVQLTPPTCPACEAAMDLINATNGAVWVCSQRPECRGRKFARKYHKPVPATAKSTDQPVEELPA